MRTNIPVQSGHVMSAPCRFAKACPSNLTLETAPTGISRMSESICLGVGISIVPGVRLPPGTTFHSWTRSNFDCQVVRVEIMSFPMGRVLRSIDPADLCYWDH
jgi:hypothetical protein